MVRKRSLSDGFLGVQMGTPMSDPGGPPGPPGFESVGGVGGGINLERPREFMPGGGGPVRPPTPVFGGPPQIPPGQPPQMPSMAPPPPPQPPPPPEPPALPRGVTFPPPPTPPAVPTAVGTEASPASFTPAALMEPRLTVPGLPTRRVPIAETINPGAASALFSGGSGNTFGRGGGLFGGGIGAQRTTAGPQATPMMLALLRVLQGQGR